jgi:ATP-binding cassette subfamily F protein 3
MLVVMVLAALRQVDKFYGEATVLQDASLELRAGARTALIGRNGAGKSTVLRLLMGLEAPDGGQAWTRDDVVVGMLAQDPDFPEGKRVLDVCEVAFAELDAIEARLQAFEAEGLDDPDTYHRWEELHATFERRGGYQRRARRDMVLHALGFAGREHEEVARFSGGEKTRLALARLLMRSPDVLLLDEPTNHLDVEMRAWLEGWLARYPGAAIVVSHDRAFLDGACDRTAEVSRGRLRERPGNPTRYREEQAEQERIDARTRANQRKEEARLAAAAAQMRKFAGQNAKLMRRALAMETRLERLRAGMLGDAERPERTVRFGFASGAGGEQVLQARHLSKGYGGVPLFRDVSLDLRAGERIAITGPNGAGKTTFLRVLLGEAASDDPRALLRWGSRVRVGYYDQELRGVDPDFTLFEELVRMVGDREAHDLLGRFLFPYGAQFKQVRQLSGGERARLALLKLTLGSYDLLVLDEPTNHLDVEMIEALEAALDAYPGTLILVSHDRRFVGRLATRVWEIEDGRFEDYEGDWAFYRRKRDERRAPPAAEPAAGNAAAHGVAGEDPPAGPDGLDAAARAEADAAADLDPRFRELSPWKLERELEALEERVAALEAELEELNGRLADPAHHDGEALADLGRAHAEAESALLEAMAAWEAAGRALDAKRAERSR